MKMKLYWAIPLALLTTFLIHWSFPLTDMGWLVWFALVPIMLALEGQGFWRGFLVSFIMAFVFQWLTLDWFGLFGWEPRLVGSLHWGFHYAFFLGTWSWFTKIRPNAPLWQKILLFPLIWIAMEWLKDKGILAFSWGVLGFTQYRFKALLQMASVTGVFGISFLIAVFNSLLARSMIILWEKTSGDKEAGRDKSPFKAGILWKHVRTLALADSGSRDLVLGWTGFVMIFASVIILGQSRIPMEVRIGAYDEVCRNPLQVGIVQPNIPINLKDMGQFIIPTLNIAEKKTRVLASQGSKLVIWPESIIRYLIPLENPYTNQMIRRSASENNIHLITGLLEKDGENIYNSAYHFGPDGEILGNYRKTHLVPLAEYNPLPERFHKYDLFSRVGNYTHGDRPGIFQLDQKKVGILICFESMFDYLARREVNQGAQVLVVITNDAWFEFSSVARMHFIMGMFRAVENRVWLVQSANTGISGIIDPWGHAVAETGIFQRVSTSGTIYFENRPTIYTRTGNILPAFCLAGTLAILLPLIFEEWKKRKSAGRACDDSKKLKKQKSSKQKTGKDKSGKSKKRPGGKKP